MRKVLMPTGNRLLLKGLYMSRYLQSLKSQMIVFLHQLKSRDNGPVLLFEILVIIAGMDTVSICFLSSFTTMDVEFKLERRKRWANFYKF